MTEQTFIACGLSPDCSAEEVRAVKAQFTTPTITALSAQQRQRAVEQHRAAGGVVTVVRAHTDQRTDAWTKHLLAAQKRLLGGAR